MNKNEKITLICSKLDSISKYSEFLRNNALRIKELVNQDNPDFTDLTIQVGLLRANNKKLKEATDTASDIEKLVSSLSSKS